MTQAPGARLGVYEITAPIGRGGMGEVYRARDTRLNRDVAIKSLPEELAHDAERLARFEREGRLLAAVNHPGIAVIYGLEEVNGSLYLILELVEGETLADRIARGRIPVKRSCTATSSPQTSSSRRKGASRCSTSGSRRCMRPKARSRACRIRRP